jgi:hypothetical protein
VFASNRSRLAAWTLQEVRLLQEHWAKGLGPGSSPTFHNIQSAPFGSYVEVSA